MARSRIITLELENDVMRLREDRVNIDDITAELNVRLSDRWDGKGECPTVSKAAVHRYMIKLDKATVPAVHEPGVARANAMRAVNLGADMQDLHEKLKTWMGEAENAKIVFTDKDGNVVSEQIDWKARTGVAQQMINSTKLYADLLERIYAADQVRQFQESVLQAIEQADPATAVRVRDALRGKRSIRQAALLGLDP